MTLKETAEQLGIRSYPEAMNNILLDGSVAQIDDPQWLLDIEQHYKVLGAYYPLVHKAVLELQKDKNRLHWGMISAHYFANCTVSEARQIPVPPRDGTLAGDFLPLLILLTQLPTGVKEYRRRKMPDDMIRRNLDHFIDGISILENRTGRPAIDQTYFNWLSKFVKATLFNCHGFNFEIRDLPANIYVLKDKSSSAIFPVLHNSTIHHSGNILNSAGCTLSDNSFQAQFTENDHAFIAHPCVNGLVCPHSSEFPKSQYDLALQPGDTVLSVHIPRKTNISAQNAAACLSAGFKAAHQHYPEFDIKALYCHSWLLDPKLKELLRPGANIPQFGELFTRFPAKSAGTEIFSFVFPRQMPFHELPENTSLERALKSHYINGNHILAYSGITFPNML